MLFPSTPLQKTLLMATCAFILAACEVGPDYQAPDANLPQNWQESALSDKAEIDQKWWKNFNDPILNDLIGKAVARNFDLKIAEARIAEARASVSSAEAALLPTGDLKGTAMREANQEALPGGKSNGLGNLLHKPYNIYQTGFDASWELDLFGGNRRAEESANAALQASEATRDDVMVSLQAEVARTYVELRHAEAKLVIAGQVVTADKKTLSLAEQRFAVGDVPQLDVVEAKSELRQADSQIPALRHQIADAQYRIDLLLGEQPGATAKLLCSYAPIPVAGQKLIMTAPAAVIAQRPDIRVAERKLAAATAQQGVATAKFYPDISLTGFFGALNTSVNNLVTAGNQSWLAGGSVLWPILSYNSLSANLDAANAQQQEAMATYQKTVLTALSDVERALNAVTEQDRALQSTADHADQDRHAAAIAQQRYKAGLTGLQEVLDANRTLFQSESNLADARADATNDLISLYKSLGGGWMKKG